MGNIKRGGALSKGYPSVQGEWSLLFLMLLGASSALVRWEPAPYDLLFFPILGVFFLRTLVWYAYQTWFLAALGLLLLSHFPALSGGLEASPARTLFYTVVTFYLALSAILLMALPERARLVFLRGFEAGALASAFLGFLAFLRFPGLEGLLWGDSRAVAFFKDPNVFGAYLIPALLLSLARVEQGRRGWLFPAIVLFLGIFSSLSRGAWVNLGVTLMGWWLLRPKKRLWLITTLVLLAGGIGLSTILAPQNPIAQRLGLMPYDADRFSAQAQALQLSLDMPFGYGPGRSEIVLDYATHNTYLRILGEIGWLGLFSWLLAIGISILWALHQALKGKSSWHEVYFAALLGIAVESLVIDTLHWRHLWFLLGLIWAKHAPPLPHHPR